MARTNDQNRQIWGLVNKLATAQGMGYSLAEEVMRDMCRAVSGQRSTKALTRPQADELITRLEAAVQRAVGLTPTHKSTGTKPAPDALITTDQERMIQLMFKDLGWTQPAQQRGLYRKVLGEGTIFPTTHREGYKVTEALKAIWMRTNKPRIARAAQHAEELHQALKASDNFTKWETVFIENLRGKIRQGRKLTPRSIMKIEEIYARRIAKNV